MRRIALILALLAAQAVAATGQPAPEVSVELEAAETVVGQPLVLRIKVLVPTWMPKPPEFPSLDVPGLLVRLPERASGPVSGRVGGETWSGVQRAYRIYPLQPGAFSIPGQTIRITYADPETTDPVTETVSLDPISLAATVPAGAEDLDPLIIASDFRLDATIEAPDVLAEGGAVVRTLTAAIDGTTPILIPRLTPQSDDAALRAYPDEPDITESEERGILSGTRRERTTYLATAAGEARLPPLRIDWFNLATGAVESAEVPPVTLTIRPGEGGSGAAIRRIDTAALLAVLAGLVAAGVLLRFARAPFRAWLARLRDRWRASERFAHRRVVAAIARKDLGGTYAALDRWRAFWPGAPADALQTALAGVGRARHGGGDAASGAEPWAAVTRGYREMRRSTRATVRRRDSAQILRPLNPAWQEPDRP